MTFGLYYQATVNPAQTWYFVAVMRSFEHVAFDRTYDVAHGIFEFFVPDGMASIFNEIMDHFVHEGMVHSYTQLPNRLIQQEL